MFGKIRRFLEKTEELKLGYRHIIPAIFALVVLRIIFVDRINSSEPQMAVYEFLFLTSWFLAATSFSVIIASLFTKTSFLKTARTFSVFYPLILLPVITKLFFNTVEGVGFVWGSWDEIVFDLFTFLWFSGMSKGFALEIFLVFVFLMIYFYAKEGKLAKSISHAIIFYLFIGIFFGAQPVLISANDTNPNAIFDVGSTYAISFFASLNVLLSFSASIFIWFYGKRERAMPFLKNIRPERMAVFLIFFAFGSFLSGEFHTWNFIIGALIVSFLWIYALLINDISDYRFDLISNKKRPLPKRIFTADEFKRLSLIFLAFSLLLSLSLSFRIFLISSVIAAVSYIYSFPPIHLKKRMYADLVLSPVRTAPFLIGYLSSLSDPIISGSAYRIYLALAIFVFLGSSVKDLKDYEADKKQKVRSFVTLLGIERARKLAGILLFSGYILLPLIAGFNEFIVPSAIAGAVCFSILFFMKKPDEKYLFSVFFIYILAIAAIILL